MFFLVRVVLPCFGGPNPIFNVSPPFLVDESATIEMAFPDVCLEVRKSEKKITLDAHVQNR